MTQRMGGFRSGGSDGGCDARYVGFCGWPCCFDADGM